MSLEGSRAGAYHVRQNAVRALAKIRHWQPPNLKNDTNESAIIKASTYMPYLCHDPLEWFRPG